MIVLYLLLFSYVSFYLTLTFNIEGSQAKEATNCSIQLLFGPVITPEIILVRVSTVRGVRYVYRYRDCTNEGKGLYC